MTKRYKALIFLGLIFCTKPGYSQWTQVTKPAGSLPFSLEIQGDTLFLGTLTSGIYRSINGGADWTQINNGLASTQIWTINKAGKAFFASSTGGKVYKSTDGGDSWTLSNSGIGAAVIVRRFVGFNGKIFASTSNSGILISNDNGSSWSTHNSGITGLVSEAITVAGNDLYTSVLQKVYKYNPDNLNWTLKSNGVPNQTLSALTSLIDNQQNIVLFGCNNNSNEVVRSTNGGDNWSLARNGLPNVGVHSLIGIGNAVFAGNEYGVYQTNDLGENWFDISGFTLTSNARFLTRSSTDLYVIQGAELWKKSLNSLVGTQEGLQGRDIRLFPNPFTDRIRISGNFNGTPPEITVFDAFGKSLFFSKDNAEIPASALSPGQYLVKIVTAGQEPTFRKMVKLGSGN